MQTTGSPAEGTPCGFYYYYKSTIDILHDLMKEGMAYRISKMNKFMAEYAKALDK